MNFDATQALRNRRIYYTPLEKMLNKLFLDIIYMPMAKIIKEDIGREWIGFHNAKEDLPHAIKSGLVQYTQDQHFEGNFNSIISREIKQLGGKWDKKWKRWYLPKENLTYNLRQAIGQSSSKFTSLQGKIDGFLSELQDMIDNVDSFDTTEQFEKIVNHLDREAKRGLEKMIVMPELSRAVKSGIARNYSDNLNLYIKNWTEESIKRLRKRVAENAFKGYRAKQLVETIKKDYATTENKAKFLARQETSLLMSKFREERYKSAGVNKYRWSTSNDSRVRDRHQLLNGQIFTWDDPPVVDDQGNRKHPGEDWNCRCVAIPIID